MVLISPFGCSDDSEGCYLLINSNNYFDILGIKLPGSLTMATYFKAPKHFICA